MITRRGILALGCLVTAAVYKPARASSEQIAIVDWALLETALAIGITPVAAVELVLFRELAIEPSVPESVIDLGLRGSINFELLATLRPSLIYGSNYSAWANETLRELAPVRAWTIFQRGEPPYEKAVAAMREMAADQGRLATAEAYIAQTESLFTNIRQRLAPKALRPLLIINLGDARHFRAFGTDSMFGDVATRLGFQNAWSRGTAYSATAPVGLEALADHPDATVVVIGPLPVEAQRILPRSAIWQNMPAVRDNRWITLSPVNPFGGLPAARRFARLLNEALEHT